MGDLKDRKRIGTTVDIDLHDKLKKISEDTMIPMSKLIEKGILLVINEYKK